MDDSAINRFWDRVDIRDEGDCWLWTGSTSGSGYGQIQIDRKRWETHRLSLFIAGFDIDGKVVRHSCDTKRCVNPRHLTPGTQLENVQDAMERGITPTGSRVGTAKLKESDIPVIRERLRLGETLKAIGLDYNVTHTVISLIKQGKTWGHV